MALPFHACRELYLRLVSEDRLIDGHPARVDHDVAAADCLVTMLAGWAHGVR